MTVAEKRRMFERLSDQSDSRAAAPIVTRSAASSSKYASNEGASLFPALLTPKTVASHPEDHFTTYPSAGESRPNHLLDFGEPCSNESHADTFPNYVKPRVCHRQRHSVAGLRKVFEQGGPTNDENAAASLSAPNTGERSRHGEAELPGERDNHGAPTLRRQNRATIGSGFRDELSRIIMEQTKQQAEQVGTLELQKTSTDSVSYSRHPVLVPKTLSVKAYLLRPESQNGRTGPVGSSTPQILDFSHGSLNEYRYTMIGSGNFHEVPDSPLLKYRRTYRRLGSVKSTPCLPIVISATVGASTHRDWVFQELRKSSSSWTVIAGGNSDCRLRTEPHGPPYSRFLHDRSADTPSAANRNRASTMRELPVKIRASLERNISLSDLTKADDQQKVASWEPRRISRAVKGRSFSGLKTSRMRGVEMNGAENEVSRKSKVPLLQRHSLAGLEGVGPEGHSWHYPDREPSFFIRATLWKVPKSKPTPDEPLPSQPTTATRSASFAELINKATATAPRLFHSARRTMSGRLLANRMSIQEVKTATKQRLHGDSIPPSYRNYPPFGCSTPGTTKPSLYDENSPSHQRSRSSHSTSLHLDRLRLRTPLEKGDPALPVLSPTQALAQTLIRPSPNPQKMRHFSGERETGLTWGRRAAAVTAKLGRRLKTRKESSSAPSEGTGPGLSSESRGSLRPRHGNAGTYRDGNENNTGSGDIFKTTTQETATLGPGRSHCGVDDARGCAAVAGGANQDGKSRRYDDERDMVAGENGTARRPVLAQNWDE
ncbi:hypothetical protein VTK26DRAFT_2769 [Humicola hyalothermophila]